MDGLYSRRREKFRVDYLKERGGLFRVVQMMLLGAVLGFLGLSPGSVTVTCHLVMTTLVLATVTVVLLAHLLGHQRRLCFSSGKSWAIVETVHDVVGAVLLAPGALLLLLPALDSSLTVAAVLTLFGLLALVVQSVENFQRARGYAVPSRLTEAVPIHTRLVMASLRPPGDAGVQTTNTTTVTVDTRPSSPSSPSPLSETTPNVARVEEARSDAGALEITETSPFISPRGVVASSAATPAANPSPLPTPSGRLAPWENPSVPCYLQVPRRTPGGAAPSPVAFLTPYETPSAFCYRTPAGPLPSTTQPTPSPVCSVFNSSYSANQDSCKGTATPGCVEKGVPLLLLPPAPERHSRRSRRGTVDPP